MLKGLRNFVKGMSLDINGDSQIIELIKRIKEEKRNTIGTLELH